MSDENNNPSPWAAPTPGAPAPTPGTPVAGPAGEPTPPPPSMPPAAAAPPPPTASVPPLEPLAVAPHEPAVSDYVTAPTPARKGRGRKVVAGVAAVAVLGAGTFAVVNLAGGSGGGASSPEDAVQALLDAAANEDVIGAMDAMAPSERNLLKDPMIDMFAELQRLEVVAGDAKLDGISGVDLVFSDLEYDTTELADGISEVEIVRGTAEISGEIAELPIGDLLIDQAFDGERPEGPIEEEPAEMDGARLVAIEEDGSWYVSLWYSVAEQARRDADLPEPDFGDGIRPKGAASPEEAVQEMVDSLTSLDVENIVAGLPPTEYRVLYDYVPLFLDDAEQATDEFRDQFQVDIADMQMEVKGSGDVRTVAITALEASIDADGSQMTMSYADGCTVIEVDGERQETCADDTGEQLESLGLGSLADIGLGEDAGVVVRQEDGGWYVDPFTTITDGMLGVMASIERNDIDTFIEELTGLGDAFLGTSDEFTFDEDFEDDFVTEDTMAFDEETEDTFATLETIPDDEFTEDTTGEITDDPYSACFETDDYQQCLLDAAASGLISESDLPIDLRFPECFGDYYEVSWELSDAEFIARVTEIHDCLAPAVSSGEIDDFQLPAEIAAPECVTLNPYNFETAPEDAFDVLYDCYLETIDG